MIISKSRELLYMCVCSENIDNRLLVGVEFKILNVDDKFFFN